MWGPLSLSSSWSILASSPGSPLTVVLGTVITLTAMHHPLTGLPRRYRLASTGSGISAVYGLTVAMASTLGRIAQIGTVRGVVRVSSLERAGAGTSSTRTELGTGPVSGQRRHGFPFAPTGDGCGTTGAATRRIVEIL